MGSSFSFKNSWCCSRQPSGIKSVELQNGLWSTLRNKKCGISKWSLPVDKPNDVWTRKSEKHKNDAEPPRHKHAVQGGAHKCKRNYDLLRLDLVSWLEEDVAVRRLAFLLPLGGRIFKTLCLSDHLFNFVCAVALSRHRHYDIMMACCQNRTTCPSWAQVPM